MANEVRKINYNPKSALNLVHGFKKGMVPWNKGGGVYSDSSRKKMSQSRIGRIPWNKGIKWPRMQGENSPVWIKDRSSLARRNGRGDTAASLTWSRNVKKRDGMKCRMSDENCKGALEAHHILPVRYFPEKRYELDNGITFCHFHHPRGKEKEEEFINSLERSSMSIT